jgi:O-methyltransferase
MDKKSFHKIIHELAMTSSKRDSDILFNYLDHIRNNNVPGDFVECGVWKGGIVLAISEYLSYHNMLDRKVWLYDTFAGLTEPTDVDFELRRNNKVSTKEIWQGQKIDDHTNAWCYGSLNEVKNNMSRTSFPQDNIVYVIGDICETLKVDENVPNRIALLRLDTDWYDSTKAEMEYLYPKVVDNGVVIVDDYNYWNGSRKAVDEYLDYKNFEYINHGDGPLNFIKK